MNKLNRKNNFLYYSYRISKCNKNNFERIILCYSGLTISSKEFTTLYIFNNNINML